MSNSLAVTKSANQLKMVRLVIANKAQARKIQQRDAQIEQLKEMMVTPVVVTIPVIKTRSGVKNAVIEYVNESKGAFTSTQIAKVTGHRVNSVSTVLGRLYDLGTVTRVREDGHPSRKVYFKA